MKRKYKGHSSQSHQQMPKKVNNNSSPPRSTRPSTHSPVNTNNNNANNNILTFNPFTVLPADETQQTDVTEQIERPPPILIKNIQNFNSMCDLIKHHIGDNFTTRTRWDDAAKCNVQLITQTLDDYRKIVKVLDEKNADYHCYQLKQEWLYATSTPQQTFKSSRTKLTQKDLKSEIYTTPFTQPPRFLYPYFF
jgi:hypothetical protein